MRPMIVLLGVSTVFATRSAKAGDPVELELQFQPVADLQIAIWLEREDGTFLRDLFVTAATGRYGLGNRPGRWDFLSSWHMVYGTRPQVLPVWASRRGQEYPRVVFADPDRADQESLGWHESSSSPEAYYCRPLTPDEHQIVAVDTMSCPSPMSFMSDKGRFLAGEKSFYPPRADLGVLHDGDHPDVAEYAALNDVDAITGPTPIGNTIVSLPATVDRDDGPLVAWIEVNLEHDENEHWSFTREDHYIDPRLSTYGVEYFGQPSVVFRVAFDPAVAGRYVVTDMVGRGSFDGSIPDLQPVDTTMSTAQGKGQDRLSLTTIEKSTFRFSVVVPDSPADPGSSGDESATGEASSEGSTTHSSGTDATGGSAGAEDHMTDRGCACRMTDIGSLEWWTLLLFLGRRSRRLP